MRLTSIEIEIIKRAALDIWGKNVSVVLFGSRTDDAKKGGDIDLLIYLPENLESKGLAFKKSEFLSRLDIKLGEQKIDLIIKNDQNKELPTVRTALLTGITL